MKLLRNGQQKSNENHHCYTCKESFEDEHAKDKRYRQLRDHCNYAG